MEKLSWIYIFIIPGAVLSALVMEDSKKTWKTAFWLGGDKNTKIVTVDIGESAFNDAFSKCPIVRGSRAVYVRTSRIPRFFNAYRIFGHTWNDEPNNKLNQDFKLFDNIDDALADRGAWSWCNYNDAGVGFPRDCGKNAWVGGWRFFGLPGSHYFSNIQSNQGIEIYMDTCPVKIQGPDSKATCGVGGTGDKRAFVISGSDAVPGAWPWMVSILKYNQQQCGGTLLTPEFVLTAAQCMTSLTRLNRLQWTIVLGSHDHRINEDSVQRVHINSVIIHPRFIKKSLESDLALLQLTSAVTLNRRVNILCLPTKGVYPPVGKECIAAGWGITNYNQNVASPTLQQASLPVVPTQRCNEIIPKNDPHTHEDVCAGNGFTSRPDGKPQPHVCHGDSGGPLFCRRSNGIYQLDGITSFGFNYCEYYDAFTPVNKYVDWINSYIKY